MPRKPALVTLMTDFGTADYFVGAMKGVVLGINPAVQIVDITHEIPPQDIETAAFTLLNAYNSFPPGTVHIAVVDPGVGSQRRPIVVTAARQFFVGPDNGLFGYLFEQEPKHRVFHLTAEKYFRRPISSTFHGRDVFAPVAAFISKGVRPRIFGPLIQDPVLLPPLASEVRGAQIEGRIIHVDHFGNCVTNISRTGMSSDVEGARIFVDGKPLVAFKKFFADGRAEQVPFAFWGSAGFMEIGVANNSAAKILNVSRGATVVIELHDE